MRTYTNIVPSFCEEPVQIECTVTIWLWKTAAPLLFIFGILGNILNLIVLTRKQLRSHPTTVLLLFLAVSDITMLLCSLTRQFMLRFNVDIKNLSSFNCTFHEWVSYTAGSYSGWILVLLTVERSVYTLWPFWARERITRRLSITAAVILLVCLACFTFQFLFMFELKTVTVDISTLNETQNLFENITVCLARTEENQEFINGSWRIVVLIFFAIVPMTIIIIGNVLIAIKMCLKKRITRNYGESGQSNTGDDQLHSLAKLLFFLCSFFVCTSLPYTLFAVIKSTVFSDVTDIRIQARLQLIQGIAHILLYFNYSFNFILYVFSGTKFKNELRKVIEEIRKHMPACAERLVGTMLHDGRQNSENTSQSV